MIAALVLGLAPIALIAQTVPDERWPDFGVSSDRGDAGAATYFQGFEAPCFGPPYNPGGAEVDWVRFYSEVDRVATGVIPSSAGFHHAEILRPLPDAPDINTGAFTRLGGYRTQFGGGFITEIDVYLDVNDPLVQSGTAAIYGFDVASAVNNQAGSWRRQFLFSVANTDDGRILVGSSNTTLFAPKPDIELGPHVVVTESDWYTLQWVFGDAGDGTLEITTNLFRDAVLLFTNSRNLPEDVIATEIGGNRYLWFTHVESGSLSIDNVRLNSGVVSAAFESLPLAGDPVDAGSALVGTAAPGATLSILSEGTQRLELCSCDITGPAAADYTLSGACPTLIEPGESQDLIIDCTPSAGGLRDATLTLVTNDSDTGTDFSYPLLCRGDVLLTQAVPVPSLRTNALLMLSVLMALMAMVFIRRQTAGVKRR